MTIIYPINGANTRLGSLFKTPKHLLLYKGVPAIVASVEYMMTKFPDAKIVILANERYASNLYLEYQVNKHVWVEVVPNTESQIETLRIGTKDITGPVMFVDCDIVPLSINEPKGNTVYLFENKLWMKQYSNYAVDLDTRNTVLACNEKGEHLPYAGAGIYYFQDVSRFNHWSEGCKSISEVIGKMITSRPFFADTTSVVYRFGTLNDIKNDESIADRIY